MQKNRRNVCSGNKLEEKLIHELVHVHNEPYAALKDAHAIAVLTEWEEFRDYDWQKIYNNMLKPAFVFDGRNLLDHEKLESIGFNVKGIGKG